MEATGKKHIQYKVVGVIIIKKVYPTLFAYLLALIIIFYFSVNSLIDSAMKTTFPNLQFISSLIIMKVLIWVVGISVKKYISKIANGNKKIELQLKVSFILGSVIAIFCILVLT
ncbi:hypothetical protein [Calidifontibacillus erzurumensis]|uniref:hypothetical protein n=1 Tax=Calidifontibacillus erzurumensis TaxID=2741433 RepID=UPI0035B54345